MAKTLLKKLGAKQITGDVKKIVREHLANDGDRMALYTVFGRVDSIRTGDHPTYGAWVAFGGMVESINHVTGEEAASNQAFLPEPLSSMLKAELENADSIEFAVTVDVKRRDDLGQGYEYLPIPHIQSTDNDPLAHLRAKLPEIAKPVALSLNAPDPEADPDDVKKSGKGKK